MKMIKGKGSKTNVLMLVCMMILLTAGSSCVSTKKYNKQLESKHSPSELQADVDYIHQKLRKYHPELYWYISKKDLDAKFDSLKISLTDSLNSFDFYFKISPVVAAIKQGHTRVLFPELMRTKAEIKKKKLKKYGTTPLDKIELKLVDGKTYVLKNSSWDTTLKVGTQIVSINGCSIDALHAKYMKTYTSDGYNNTFYNSYISKNFSAYFKKDFGILDSLTCTAVFGDSVKRVELYRVNRFDTLSSEVNDKKIKQTKKQKDSVAYEKKRRLLQGYDKIGKSYSMDLQICKSDSSVAILTIKNFSSGNFRKYFKQVFKKLDSLHVKSLVIDIRDNLGGRLKQVETLYAYMADSSFKFIDKAKISGPKGMLLTLPFKVTPPVVLPFTVVLYPLYAVFSIPRLSKENGEWYFRLNSRRNIRIQKERFNGKVFVLINGASFSASSILSSNLKGSKRATFIGEETGGAYNGTIAGVMPVYKLPHSKISVKFGFLKVVPHYKSLPDGYGIVPDIEVSESVVAIKEGRDLQMEKVLEIIKGN